MHDHCALCAEPSVQMRNTRDAIAFRDCSVGSSLNKMLGHVALEVGQQFHFLFEFRRIRVDCDVGFLAFFVDEVNITGTKILS